MTEMTEKAEGSDRRRAVERSRPSTGLAELERPRGSLWEPWVGPGTPLAEYFDRMFDEFHRELRAVGGPDLARWGPPSWGGWLRAMADVEDTGPAFEVRANLPGMSKDQIDVRLRGRTLRIEAHRTSESERNRRQFVSRERSYEGFSRTVELPEEVVADQMAANYVDGVLTVTVPKAHPVPEHRVVVR
jgi:HSP20 family protein